MIKNIQLSVDNFNAHVGESINFWSYFSRNKYLCKCDWTGLPYGLTSREFDYFSAIHEKYLEDINNE